MKEQIEKSVSRRGIVASTVASIAALPILVRPWHFFPEKSPSTQCSQTDVPAPMGIPGVSYFRADAKDQDFTRLHGSKGHKLYLNGEDVTARATECDLGPKQESGDRWVRLITCRKPLTQIVYFGHVEIR
jgi:hypothetical protein